MFEDAKTFDTSEKIKHWLPSLFVAAAAYYILSTRGTFSYMDNFDLIIHEAGHFIFSWCGDTIYILGGTLMQLLVPFLLITFSLYNSFQYFFQFSLLIFAQNCINISVYAADAQAMQITLFGPIGAKHDWNSLLTKYKLLEYSGDISMFFVVLACIGRPPTKTRLVIASKET